MYETYGTYVDDEYFDNHDFDDDTDDDIYIIVQYYKIPKASFKWVPDLGTSPGHEPIIAQSCRAVLSWFFHVELIEIYPPVPFPSPYNGSKTHLCPNNWPT